MTPVYSFSLSPSSSSFRRRVGLGIGIGLLLTALIAVGCSEVADTAGPPDAAATLTPQTAGPGSITVEVRDGGQRHEFVLVTIAHNLYGPYRGPDQQGDILKKVTDANGIATFDGLPVDDGGWCAHITAVSDQNDAIAFGDLIVPIADQVGSTVNIAPGITERQGGGGNVRTVPFTEVNYVKNCVETTAAHTNLPPIELTSQKPAASVRMSGGQGAILELNFADLQGDDVIPAGWLVVGNTSAAWRAHFSWLPGSDKLAEDIHPGILVAVQAVQNNASGKVSFRGLPHGQDVALEALTNRGGGQGLLVATGRSSELSETIAMEPLMCVLDNTKQAHPNTATGGSVEIVGKVKDGFLANESFQARSAVSIWYEVAGNGSDALQMRFKNAAGQTRNLNVSYSCVSGQCSASTPSGSSGATAKLFQRDADNGRLQLTWLIENLPYQGGAQSATQRLASVEYQFRDFPEPSKNEQVRAYSLIGLPDFSADCEIDQSNDPRWWIAN